jgi:catechol 2,3-dioxygenase-like lactoylglutathione lyase family enzyme
VNASGIAHLCIQARDGYTARSALGAEAASFLSDPVPLGTGFHYAYGHDRGGRLFELESAPFLPVSPLSWFGHVAFVSSDAERLATFYASVLGVPVSPGGRYSGNPQIDRVAGLDGVDVEVWWVRTGDFTLEFWRYHAPAAQKIASEEWYSHIGLEADDLGVALKRVQSSGGTIEEASTRGSDGQEAWARDPDGNRIHLIEFDGPALSVRALRERDALARAGAARAAATAA